MASEDGKAKRALTPEEKAAVNAKARAAHRRRRESETPERRAARLEKQRSAERAYREKNPDKIRDKNARLMERHRERWNALKCARRAADPLLAEKQRQSVKECIRRNPEREKLLRQERYKKNIDVMRARCRAWHANNRELSRAKSRFWQAANREKAAESARERRKKNPGAEKTRYNSDLIYRLKKTMRCRLWAAITRSKGHKSARTFELIGCTPDDLRKHLECQFEPWMTWENYGSEWHVDHIKQCSSFDLIDPAQQRECFHYSNLRPLSVPENLSRPRFRRGYPKSAAA